MNFPTIPDSDDHKLERKASNLQFKDFLSVWKGNEWVPISFDTLEGKDCDKIITRKAVLTDKPYIGYKFPVKSCRYVSESYLLSDQRGKELKALPEYYGTGFYESYYDRNVFVNAHNGALGMKDDITLRVGLDYVVAKESLPASS